MNLKIFALFLFIICRCDIYARAHLRPLYPDKDSDEDSIVNGNAPKILSLLRPRSHISPDSEQMSAENRKPSLHWPRPILTPRKPYNSNSAEPAAVNATAFGQRTETSSYIKADSLFVDDSDLAFKPHRYRPIGSFEQTYCEPEAFEHDYIVVENRTHPTTNSWQRARPGERAGLEEVCLKRNGLPLTRKCRYNKETHTAEWEDISNWPRIECLRQTRECILSDKLNTLHRQLLDKTLVDDGRGTKLRQVTERVNSMLRETNFKLLPADVHLTSQILYEVADTAQDTELTDDMVSICDRLMSSDPQILRISADLNATNSILSTFEQYMDDLAEQQVPTESCGNRLKTTIVSSPSEESSNDTVSSYAYTVEEVKMGYLGVRAHISSNISVFFINPRCANISGIAVYAPTAQQGIQPNVLLNATVANFRYRFIYMNESVAALTQEADLEVASFLPTTLWEEVSTTMNTTIAQPVVVLKVYGHDALFVDPALVHTRKPFSKILSISIPGYNGTFSEPLPFLLRNQFSHKDASLLAQPGTGCGYWNYSTWVKDGVQTNITDFLTQSVIECHTQHLTQFSFLLGGSYRQSDVSDDVLITPIHLRALDIISLIGCSLSLIGLLGIWLTALLFKSWRTLASTKVLLNLCVALTLQMVLFVFVNTEDMSAELVEDREYIDCIILGAFLQYSILVLFTWMLIIAVLQFQRYVTVIGIDRPKRYILKSAIVAWGLPLLPTLLVACIDPTSYIPSEYELQTSSGICYPSGLGLTLGVILPICIVVIANLTIFVYVFYSISHTLNQAMQRSEKKMIVKQIRLSVLLFFLLGISWIFGLFAYMQGGGIIFSYLFCLTATMQGFVLFIYFVLLDEVPRNAWLNLLNPHRKSKSGKRTTELQSMTSSTAAESGACSRDTNSRERHSGNRNGNSPQQPLEVVNLERAT